MSGSQITCALILVSLFAPLCVQAQSTKEQRDFGPEVDINHPVHLPTSVLQLLEHDEFIADTLANSDPHLSHIPLDWTEGSVVHLNSPSEIDYVVIGEKNLAGAHATHIWFVRMTAGCPKIVLVAFCDALHIARTRNNGLLNIVSTSVMKAGAIVTDDEYKFDGQRYKLSRSTTTKN
jgi:hypothetical protein